MRVSKHFPKSYWLMSILLMISVATFIKGCDSDHSSGPAATSTSGVGMRILGASEMQAKALGVTIAGVGLDDLGNPTDVTAEPVVISNPVFPLDVPLTVFVPPCRWRITVTVALTRDRPRIKNTDIDACSSVTIDLPVETFEAMYIPSGSDPLQVPESAQAGETLVVSCGGVSIDAPDSDSDPLVATVSEQAGPSVSGPIDATNSVSGSFPDPYELSSPQEQRVFHCTISDGRSPAQSFRKAVRRILSVPEPTETPSPTSTATPEPDATPSPTPTETPTPTPDPCQVSNNNDSGTGSLRRVLTDAGINGCSTISFASSLSTITLSSQLVISSGTLTIDGGSGVTVSGGNTTRVFEVNSGTNVTFENLTITNGQAGDGGGIYNYGTITIGSGTVISGNTANSHYYGGGGIYNHSGTITINGTVSGNTATDDGGGIYNNSGAVTVNGTIENNTAYGSNIDSPPTDGGGGIFNWHGVVTINCDANIRGNAVGDGDPGDHGGGIYNGDGTVTFNNGIVENNTVTGGAGGGIYNNAGTIAGAPTYNSGNTPNNCDGLGGCPCFAGMNIGGYCWYFGGWGESCDAVCSTHGGYHSATQSYAGSSGTDANCINVLDSLGVPVGALNPGGADRGCCYDAQHSIRYRDPLPTSSSSTHHVVQRACACSN